MRDLNLSERVAWLNRDAASLATDDLVELKICLKSLISDATETLELCRNEIQQAERSKLIQNKVARRRTAAEVNP